MPEKSTQRPVFVAYYEDAPADELHPAGVAAGTRIEAPTPAIARQFHPHGHITGYTDGTPYQHRAALAEERKEKPVAVADEVDVPKPARARSRAATTSTGSKSKTASTRGSSSKRASASQTSAKPEKVVPALAVVETVPEPVQRVDEPATPE